MDIASLQAIADPASLPNDHLRAVWQDLHGNWDAAHRIVQALPDDLASWIHAYLHRKEPDLDNARYWYRRAGRPFPSDPSFPAEAAAILAEIP